MEHTQPKPRPLAIWNPATDRWELEQETIFGHSDAYSETWPTSGMTVNGVAYELPTWEHHTAGTAYSSSQHDETLLQTPLASEGSKPSNTMGVDRRLSTGQVFLTNQIVSLCGLDPTEESKLLPTPNSADVGRGNQHPDKRRAGGHQVSLGSVAEFMLLPTPNTMDMLPAREGEAMERQLRRGQGENASRRTTMGNLREDILQTVNPDVFKPTGESMPRLFVGSEPCEEPTLPLGEIHGSETATAGSPVLGESEKDRNLLAVDRCEREQVRTRKVHEPREEFESTPVCVGGPGGSYSGRSDVGSSVQSSCVRESGSSGASDSCGECSSPGRSENPLPAGASSSWRQPLSESENRPSDVPCVSADSRSEEQGEKTQWGIYSSAIERWEALRGTAPAPTELTAKGKHRLNAEFASWMMGLEPGHVTGVSGLTRNEQLKAIGNGVVPQQAIAALKHMLGAS